MGILATKQGQPQSTGYKPADKNTSKQQHKSQNSKAKPEKKFEVDNDIWSLFTGIYSLFTYFTIVTDQIENQTAMNARHLNNAQALTHELDKANISAQDRAELEKEKALMFSKPSFFKTLLDPIAKVIFPTVKTEKGVELKDSYKFDGLISFYGRFLKRIFGPLAKAMGLRFPFNLPTDYDLSLTDEERKTVKNEFNFLAHRDLERDPETGKMKNPKGHIDRWTLTVNPDPSINDPNLDMNKVPEDHPRKNKPRHGLLGFWYRMCHPAASRNALSFIFNAKNDIDVLKGALNPPKNIGMIGGALNLLKMFSSTISSLFAPAGSFASWAFAISGKKNLVDAGSLLALIGSIYIPANYALENMVKFISAWNTSTKEKRPFKETLKELGLDWSKIFQGLAGGVAAIPAIPGFVMRMLQVYKDTRYFFVPAAREFVKVMHGWMHGTGFIKNADSSALQDKAENAVKKIAKVLGGAPVNILESFLNFAPIKLVASKILATNDKGRISCDIYRNILNDITKTGEEGHTMETQDPEKYKNFYGLPTADAEARDFSKEMSVKNKILGAIPKSESLMYLFKIFGAFEAWVVTLPYAMTKRTDKDIQENAVAPIRWFDQVVGTINSMLAIPNNIIYGLTARGPQTLAGLYEVKQRFEEGKGNKDYNVMTDKVIPHAEWLLNSSFPLFRYVGKMIKEDIIDCGMDTFTDHQKTNHIMTQRFEKLSFKQEYCTEAPTAVNYIRNFIKWSMLKMPMLRKGGAPMNKFVHDLKSKRKSLLSTILGKVMPNPKKLLSKVGGKFKPQEAGNNVQQQNVQEPALAKAA